MALYNGLKRDGTRVLLGDVLFGEHIPTSAQDVYDREEWEREDGDGFWVPAESGELNDGSIFIPIPESRGELYKIEVRTSTSSRSLKKRVREWYKGTLERELYRGNTITFVMPYDNVDDVVSPNSVWLRDRYNHVIDVFKIQNIREIQNGKSKELEVKGISRLTQLGLEYVTEMDYEDTDIHTIVANMLEEFQTQDNPIVLGDIDAVVGEQTVSIHLINSTVLAALLKIQEQMPQDVEGVFYVDSHGRFKWKEHIGKTSGQVLAIDTNMTAVAREIDYHDQFSRVSLYGEGEIALGSAVKLTDAGEPQDYIEADPLPAEGTITRVLQDKSIRYPSALLARAQKLLSIHEDPLYFFNVNVLQLSFSDQDAYSNYKDLIIGSSTRVIAEGVDIDVEKLRIIKIVQSLDNPLVLQVQFSNRTNDLADIIADIYGRIYSPLWYLDDGSRHPYMGRTLPFGFSEDGFSPKDMDLRINPGPPRRTGRCRWGRPRSLPRRIRPPP